MLRTARKLAFVFALLFGAHCLANGVIVIYPPIPPPHPIPPPYPILPPRPPRPPRPPLERMATLQVKQAKLDVTIETGTATTFVDQLFHNPTARPVEGTFLFPLPEDAAISRFGMYVDGKELQAELLDRDQANKIYEDIVRRMIDPALLEYAGRRLIRARIFPIPPNGDVRVTLNYSQPLRFDGGLYAYRYPLDTNKFSPQPLESLVVGVKIRSNQAIKTVFSPTHNIDVTKKDDHNAVAGFEAKSVKPDKDFVLYYTVGEQALGASAVTYRERGKDGFFLLLVAPRMAEGDRKAMPKDVAFVFDTSGSMLDNDKIGQARRALTFCLKSLKPDDRFAIVDFSTTARTFRGELVKADPPNVEDAIKYVEGLAARGGTNIEEALATALKMGGGDDPPYYVVFLTDGIPTIGEENPTKLSEMAKRLASERVRLFTFGVGHDVNTLLLDTLAADNRGDRTYVEPGEDMEHKVSSFYTKIASPVLSDVSLSVSKANTYDEFPRGMPDIFRGSQIAVVGRYRDAGGVLVKLTGKVNGQSREYVFEANFVESDTRQEFLPRLWAVRKVGWLLDEIRLRGEKPELKDEVVRLSKEYGIMTPYTAYLVVEDAARRPAGPRPEPTEVFREVRRGRLHSLRMKGMAENEAAGADVMAPSAPAVGGLAIRRSEAARALRQGRSEAIEEEFLGEKRDRLLRHVGDRAYYFVEGRWIVSSWDETKTTRKVEYLSDEYFDLARNDRDLARAFALGARVIAESMGVYYEVVE